MPRWPIRPRPDRPAQLQPEYRALLDRAALAADAALHAAALRAGGVDAGNGWQQQEGAGPWGSDWFGRAQAAVIYILGQRLP